MLVLFGHSDDPSANQFLDWIMKESGCIYRIFDPSICLDYYIEFENDCEATAFLLRWS
jgi:hypothetical protein